MVAWWLERRTRTRWALCVSASLVYCFAAPALAAEEQEPRRGPFTFSIGVGGGVIGSEQSALFALGVAPAASLGFYVTRRVAVLGRVVESEFSERTTGTWILGYYGIELLGWLSNVFFLAGGAGGAVATSFHVGSSSAPAFTLRCGVASQLGSNDAVSFGPMMLVSTDSTVTGIAGAVVMEFHHY